MLNAKVIGHGLPIVFLHGYCEDLNLWNSLAEKLKDQHKVILLDLPGFGASPPQTDIISIEDVATIVHDFLYHELNLNKFVVLGHSLGGYVGLAMKDLYPDNVQALGLINSTSFADSEEKKKIRDKTIAFIDKHGVSKFLEEFVKNLFTIENQSLLKEDIDSVLNMGISLTKETVIQYMKIMRNRPNRSFILQQQNKVLFLGGAEDSHIDLSSIKNQLNMLSETENGNIFKNTAHMSMYEAPSSLAKAIKSFILSLKMPENG